MKVSFISFTSVFLQYVTLHMGASYWHCMQHLKMILQCFENKSAVKMDRKKVWALQYVCSKNCTISGYSFGRVA
jgi:hypothetical protein